jgi:methylase of polypeptide subunit release factors
LIKRGGTLIMEMGDGQSKAVRSIVESAKIFTTMEVLPDLAHRDRIFVASGWAGETGRALDKNP